MFAVRAFSEVAVKATQITGLAAGREYLNFFFNPVGCICRLYRRHGPVMALGRVALKQPRDFAGDDFAAFPIYGRARDAHQSHRSHLDESASRPPDDQCKEGSKLFRQ